MTPAARKTAKTPARDRKTPPPTNPTPTKPGRAQTPKMNLQKTAKINFYLGRFNLEEEAKLGKVKKAKMTIEERMRKEKRDKIMEDIRKPIILTPGSKIG